MRQRRRPPARPIRSPRALWLLVLVVGLVLVVLACPVAGALEGGGGGAAAGTDRWGADPASSRPADRDAAPEATRSAAAEADREAAREGATGSAGGAAAQLGAGAAGDLPYQPPPEPMPAH